MKSQFMFSITRAYGFLEDEQTYTVFAKDLTEAILLAVADLGDIYAQTADEAELKAKTMLDQELGQGWSVNDFLDSNLELWTDGILYRVDNIFEQPPINH